MLMKRSFVSAKIKKTDGVRVMAFQTPEGDYVGQILNSAAEIKDINLEFEGKTDPPYSSAG